MPIPEATPADLLADALRAELAEARWQHQLHRTMLRISLEGLMRLALAHSDAARTQLVEAVCSAVLTSLDFPNAKAFTDWVLNDKAYLDDRETAVELHKRRGCCDGSGVVAVEELTADQILTAILAGRPPGGSTCGH